MTTYKIIIERTTHYEVEIEAVDVEAAILSSRTALEDEEGGPDAWPNSIVEQRIISANTVA